MSNHSFGLRHIPLFVLLRLVYPFGWLYVRKPVLFTVLVAVIGFAAGWYVGRG
jgi:hypothetical protein